MIPYIGHVTVILTVCFLFYKLFLQKATFYWLNRWTLLSCLVLSFVLPLLPAPRGWSLSIPTAAAIHPVATALASPPGSLTDPPSTVPTADNAPLSPTAATSSGTVRSAAATIRPATVRTQPLNTAPQSSTTAPQPTIASPSPVAPRLTTITPSTTPSSASLIIRILTILSWLYFAGLFVFALRFASQIAVLCYRAYTCPSIREGRYRIVQTGNHRGPCSFGNTIFINPSLYDPETFQQILVHEKIHVSGGHTLDLLLAELALVFQWFNPLAWLYRREVENNLEFLTDRSVLQHPHIERLSYQLSLLRVSAPHLPFSITNNYNQSLLKRRIVMMNSQRSARYTVWKYVALVPVLTLLVCLFNKPAALARTGTARIDAAKDKGAANGIAAKDTSIRPARTTPASTRSNAATTTTATSTITEEDSIDAATFRGANTTSTFSTSGTTRAEPVIAVSGLSTTLTSNGSLSASDMSLSVEPAIATTISASADIHPQIAVGALSISDTTGPYVFDLHQGSWFLSADSDDMEFTLRAQHDENSWQSSFTAKKSELTPIPGQGTVEFKLIREAGTMTFKGQFDGEQGLGHFQYHPDPAYFDAIKKLGVEDMQEGRDHAFFLVNVTKEFVALLNRTGYTPVSQRDLISLAAHHVDEPFLRYWKNSGVAGADEVRSLITLKALHIDYDYVEELKKAGYSQLTVRQLISLKAQHIDGQYVRGMNANSAATLSPEQLVSYHAMHIDSVWLNSLKKVGYDHLEPSEIRTLSGAHVTAEYVKSWQDAGFNNIAPHTIAGLKSRGITPEFAKGFRGLGYTDLDLNHLYSIYNAGITPEFVTAFHKIGYDNIPFNLLYTLKNSGVDADYVAKMKEKGFNSTDLNKYVRLKRDFN